MTGDGRRYHSRDELRDALLGAGREILVEEGLGAGSTTLTFKRVFERVERNTGVHLTNASVIKRIWENQAAFQADVLADVAQDEGRTQADQSMRALRGFLARSDVSTKESRAWAAREMCRVGGTSSEPLADSGNWTLWMSVLAMASNPSHPEQRQIHDALEVGNRAAAKFWEERLAEVLSVLGLRLRWPLTMRVFIEATTAYAKGCSIHQVTGHSSGVILRPTGRNGEEQEWTLFAVGLEAMMGQFFEPDPAFVAPSPSHAPPSGSQPGSVRPDRHLQG